MSRFRLKHPVTEQVYQALTDIEQAEERLQKALNELPALIGDNTDLRRHVLFHLYWFEEGIKPSWLARVFGITNKQQVSREAGFATATGPCRDCKQSFEFKVTSRANINDPYRRCEACQAKWEREHAQGNDQWLAEYNAQIEAQKARIAVLRTMPYREYLQTPEWQDRRMRAMKRAGFRCQVCNAYGVRLNVHHRTYERRGHEDDRDLITLCEDCHAIFHENGSLAEVEA